MKHSTTLLFVLLNLFRQETTESFEISFQARDVFILIGIICILIFFVSIFVILLCLFILTADFFKDPIISAVQGIHKFVSGTLLQLETASKVSIKNLKTVFFWLKNSIITAGKNFNTILLLAIEKFSRFFKDTHSLISGLFENKKLIQWFTEAKLFFYPPYALTLGFFALYKPAVIRDYASQILQIYSTAWNGLFGGCLGFIFGVIIVFLFLFLAALYIKCELQQVKHGHFWEKLVCLATRIGRVTLGIMMLYSICKYGGIVIMWNENWDLLYDMLVCCLTSWAFPMPSVWCLPMLPTNFSFNQPVTSQAVVASPPAGVIVLMRISEQVESVAVTVLVEDSVASQAGVPAGRGPVIIIRPPDHDTIYDQRGSGHLPFRRQAVPLSALPLPDHFNSLPDLRSTLHPLFPRQTGIGMPATWGEEGLPHQRDLRYDGKLSFINSWEGIVPVIAGELPILEAKRTPYIEWQNRLNNPLRPAIVSARDALNLEVLPGSWRPNLLNDERLLRMAAVDALNIEWSIMVYYDKLVTQVFPLKEHLEMEISGIERQIEQLRQYASPDHLRLLSLDQENRVNNFRLQTLIDEYKELRHRMCFLGLSQDLNNARGESNVCLYKHQQFVRAVIEGKVDFPRLVRAEDMRRIEQIYYPALYDKYPALQPDVTRPLMKWEFGVIRQEELNKAIGGGLLPYLMAVK